MPNAATLSQIYDAHLHRVSRSFAFCIQQLKEPLKHRVGLAYLICRILDTVEDSPYSSAQEKYEQLNTFESFVRERPSEKELQTWADRVPTQLTDSELTLLKDSSLIFNDLHDLPEKPRQVLQNTALDMARGMRYFLQRSKGTQELVLHSLSDVNRYCFFVAGIVGEMLTGLFSAVKPEYQVTEAKLLEAHQFGLFLQKINVLKDQLEDQKVGRFLVPSQLEVWKSLEANAKGALDYLIHIPVEEKEYRIFCAWSLFLGLASIPWIKRTWAAKIIDKIPRAATQAILDQVTAVIDDNEKLKSLFDKMKPESLGLATPPILDHEFPEFQALYHGKLSRHHLQELGMVAR